MSIDHYDRYVEFLVADDAGWDGENPGFFGSGVIDLIDEDKISEAIEMTIDAGTWNVPTLSLVEHLASDEPAEEMAQWPEMKYLPAHIVEGWVNSKHEFQKRDDFQPEATDRLIEIRQLLTRELYHSGANVVLGSDAPQFFNVPGFSIHHEMEMMVAAGLTPYEVLVTGTVNPAIYYETTDEFGTVEENRRADLILLDANPLENISNVQQRAGVMIRGIWWPENEIQSKLDEIADRVQQL
ncbi:MAG TPA: amidohydrolase family protein, partial [Fodinibius sp.]|nr:amidohydrolase family protein [Fodinibius sp.]